LANIQGDEVPELKELLEQNFIAENGLFRRPQSEPEKNIVIEKREKQLLRQFESLLIQAQKEKKKIKSVRKEAVQLGFEHCYKEKRFQDILTLAGKIDKKILEENSELNEFKEAAEIMIDGIK
jgi:RNase adaptor protein for sRNA GlmZ degradation